MILRRVIAHFRKQEWTAIFLDFVIVVAGVFVGLQVANWNAARADRERAASYLVRLHDDVADDIVMLQARQRFWERMMEAGMEALDAREAPPSTREDAWRVVMNFHHASNTVPLHLRNGTYADMVSSGQLGLIRNTQLRDLTTNYYTNSWGVELSSLIPAYRMAVRRVIPPEIHTYLLPCHRHDGAHQHILDDCPMPATNTDLLSLADGLANDEQLRGDLIQALSVMRTSTSIAHNVLVPAAQNLQAAIAAELERLGVEAPTP